MSIFSSTGRAVWSSLPEANDFAVDDRVGHPASSDSKGGRAGMRCAECGVECADVTRLCVVCGAPVARQVRRRPLRRAPLVWANLGFVAAAAAVVLVVAAHQTGGLTAGQLRTGDCLTGSHLGMGTGGTWPSGVRALPCTDQHFAEVIFSGNAWPQSMAYPGYGIVANQGHAFCISAFDTYDGVTDSSTSQFQVDGIAPDNASWSSGDRRLVCLAYQSWPIKYSIKGSKQ